MAGSDEKKKILHHDNIDDDDDQSPIPVGVNEHRLQYTYGFWYSGKTNYLEYDTAIRKIGRFASVEQFWALYSHLIRPSELTSGTFFIFRDGLKPLWEHKSNRDGGQWQVRLNKGLSARCWENLVLAILGEQFKLGDEICGAGVSVKRKYDHITLWNKTTDQETINYIRDILRKVLNLPSHVQLEYRSHKESINWLREKDSGHGGGGHMNPGPHSHYPSKFERSGSPHGDGSHHRNVSGSNLPSHGYSSVSSSGHRIKKDVS